MADRSAIEWTDASWTPIRARNRATAKVGWHCTHATPGCVFCYAEGINKRLGTGLPFKPGHMKDVEIFLDEKMLTAPLRWKRPRMIFVCSMTDLFADFVPDEMIDRIFAVMALAPQHTFQVLTKRSRRMRDYVSGFTCDGARRFNIAAAAGRMMEDGDKAHDWVANAAWPLPNVWLGVSAEDQARADERIPDLLATPAAVRFLSAEPLLGPLNLGQLAQPNHGFGPFWIDALNAGRMGWYCDEEATNPTEADPLALSDAPSLNWVIVGGESGRGARPMHPDWARQLRDQCAAAGVPFFFKQWGAHRPLTAAEHGQACGATLIGENPYDKDAYVLHVGKNAAGRLLDGVEHNDMPQAREGEPCPEGPGDNDLSTGRANAL